MAKKEFSFRGKSLEEVQRMSQAEYIQLFNARQRRSLKRRTSEQAKKVLEEVKSKDKNIKTHVRDMIIIPEMVNQTIKIFTGKEFLPVIIQPEMIGHYLGEFAPTRKRLHHSAPGVGATKSSAAISVR